MYRPGPVIQDVRLWAAWARTSKPASDGTARSRPPRPDPTPCCPAPAASVGTVQARTVSSNVPHSHLCRGKWDARRAPTWPGNSAARARADAGAGRDLAVGGARLAHG